MSVHDNRPGVVSYVAVDAGGVDGGINVWVSRGHAVSGLGIAATLTREDAQTLYRDLGKLLGAHTTSSLDSDGVFRPAHYRLVREIAREEISVALRNMARSVTRSPSSGGPM